MAQLAMSCGYHNPWSPVQARAQFEILGLGPSDCSKVLIEKNTFWFSFN